jgi:halocyanin-like protein
MTDEGGGPAVSRRRLLAGAAGTAGAATFAGVANAQQAPYDGWFTGSTGGAADNYNGSTADLRGESSVSVEVGADGNGGTFAFAPAAIRVDPGTTVTFEWTSDTHNILVEEQPDGAGWEGLSEIKNTGYSYEHTFETEGVYKYYCEPHFSLGMKGAVVVGAADVGESAAGGDGGDGGGGAGPLPGGPVGSFVVGTVFATAALGLAALLGAEGLVAYRDRPDADELGDPTEAPERAPSVELGHDEFDPTGTLALVVVYFVILLVMWVFMYFVEFLGRGPTVIG